VVHKEGIKQKNYMLREIYFRDPSDPKFINGFLEINDKKEALISKLRMIVYTNRGEVLGEPELGLDLESYLFETNFNELVIRDRFYAQLAKYIPEHPEYEIDVSFSTQSDGVKDTIFMYVTLNEEKVIGLEI